MSARFQGQIAVVTGGARGFGLGIARRLASEGAKVVLWDIEFPPEVDLAGFETRKVDVTDPEVVTLAMQAVLDAHGRIDVFVNNAGITGTNRPVEDCAISDWNRVLMLDLTAVFLCCRACIPAMRAQGYGRIVNVASIAGKEGIPGLSAYAAAKAGVIGLTKSIARELAGSGVIANAVAPAMAETELLHKLSPDFIEASRQKIPMGRFLAVDELATVVAFAASRENSFTTGFTFDATGGRADY